LVDQLVVVSATELVVELVDQLVAELVAASAAE
jgi:hypothetical protein